MSDLSDKRIAFIVHNYIEEPELVDTKAALEKAGAKIDVIAPKAGQVQTMQNDVDMASKQPVDLTFDEANFDDYDALVVPGGTVNADNLRMLQAAQDAAAAFADSSRPLALICHAPWLLVSAGLAKGHKLTSFETLQDDLKNAGADWVDQEVVVDGNLITSRNPDDIPAFTNAIIDMLS